jgi:SnoaL-like domain
MARLVVAKSGENVARHAPHVPFRVLMMKSATGEDFQMAKSLEQRLTAVEDALEIYNLIASHPPSADTGSENYGRHAYAKDGVIDLGGGKGAHGNEAISQVVRKPDHLAAIEGGLAHFCGLPRVDVTGDTATATSYLQVITPNRDGQDVDVPNHGVSKGYRIHRLGANRWEFTRTAQGWKITRRTYRQLDGNQDARDLLRQAAAQVGA